MPDESSDPPPDRSKRPAAAVTEPLDSDAVIAEERATLASRRRARELPSLGRDPRLAGLAFSGGGIRSAAVCLGVLQGLNAWSALKRFDYLSTVSGGGYIGSSLSAAMSGAGAGFPFGTAVEDSPVVAWLRNYSNYLLPRERSSIRNWLEAIAILLRGLVANAVCVACFLFAGVILTLIAYPDPAQLGDVNFLPRLAIGSVRIVSNARWTAGLEAGPPSFFVPAALLAVLALELLAWAMMRSLRSLDELTGDGSSVMLRFAFLLLGAACGTALLDAQPLIILVLRWVGRWAGEGSVLYALPLLALAVAVLAFFAGRLGRFLETSKRSAGAVSMSLRIATQAMLVAGALIVPLLIWSSYALVYSWTAQGADVELPLGPTESRFDLILQLFAITLVAMLGLRANSYSLHSLYRDRLGHAFLGGLPAAAEEETDGRAGLDGLKLSGLGDGSGPFHIINCALNVEGSLEANKRGRNADFFIFTPLRAGSALTHYVPVRAMEQADPRLDLAGAMAMSGAAASANMGSSTVRILSPTLSLMNIRLGYYLPNPKFMSEKDGKWTSDASRFGKRLWDRFFLLIEMFNMMTEDSGTIYLTDGGHIENLGIYELLRRKCRLIVAVDSEADPNLGCGSLLKLERYARIDLGVRITVPWEEIARQSRAVSASLGEERAICDPGPHCAIGRIIYGDKTEGVLVYVKSSLSGDEKDYILDYARRNAAFPHEATSDQFFSEEQFEMYRALGFHMIDGLFGEDRVSVIEGDGGWETVSAARAELKAFLGAAKTS